MSDLFDSRKPLVDSSWIRTVGLALSEILPLERGRQIAEFLRRTNQPALVISIPGHTMRVTVSDNAAVLDDDTFAALGSKPTKLNRDQILDLINGLRQKIGLKPLDKDTATWNPLR